MTITLWTLHRTFQHYKVSSHYIANVYEILFHHPYHQREEKVKSRAENMFLLPGTSSGQ